MKPTETGYWAEHPASPLLSEAELRSAVTASGHHLTRTYGTCMWPGVREGDLIFYAPLGPEPLAPLVGQIAVAQSSIGPVAHRIRRVFGAAGREWVILAGDLSPDDPPRRRPELLGLARALYRPGQGFVDLPKPLNVDPLLAAILQRLGQFFTWAQRRVSAQAAGRPEH
jgi:hypothetical protein